MKIKKEIISLFLIFLLALFLRFNNLTAIPNGFNQDESAIGYNAFSILQTGKDEYGQSFPVYFKSFGDQKLPVYIYLTALSESIFGVNEFAVRFPSALLGSIAVLLLYFVVKLVSDNSRLALLSALFLAINPWHLLFSRAAFETNAALTFVLFGVLFFLVGFKFKKWFYLFLSLFAFALALYAYNVTRLLSPVLLAGLVWINWKTVKSIPPQILFSLGLFLFILLSPFLITFFSPAGASSAHGALITSTDIQAKNIAMRSYLVDSMLGSLLGKVFFNSYFALFWQYLQNIVGVFSVNFFFISGSPHGSQGSGMGQMYLLQFPFLILGVVLFFIHKLRNLSFFVLWAIITVLILGLSKEVPHATRGYFLVIPLTIFSALGLLFLIDWFKGVANVTLRTFLIIAVAGLCLYNLVYYFSSFYFRFPSEYAKSWRQQDKALSLYLKESETKYDKIIIDNKAGFMYTSFLFFTQYSPELLQQTIQRAPDDSEGFSYVRSFGKYQWKDIDWENDLKEKNVLFVTAPGKLPSSVGILKAFHYPQIPVVLSVKEQITQYPLQEEAYLLVEKN